jgi:hypothetical protein
VAFILYVAIDTTAAPSNGKDGAEQAAELVGRVIGTFFGLLVIVGIASAWESNRTWKRRVTVFLVATLTLLVLGNVPRLLFTVGASNSGPPWEYRSDEHGFSMVLPSSSWKKSQKQKDIVDFACAIPLPMLAGVQSVEKQSLEEFQASVSGFKRAVEKNSKSDAPLRFEDGQTASGDRNVFVSWHEHAGQKNERLYVAASRVWLSSKGITVTVLFEGHSFMVSDHGRAAEDAEFEKAAKAICFSVK